MAPHFFRASAHIGLLELPRTSILGHRGHTGAALDVGATLVGSSDENTGLMSAMSVRSLTALGHCALVTTVLMQCVEQTSRGSCPPLVGGLIEGGTVQRPPEVGGAPVFFFRYFYDKFSE